MADKKADKNKNEKPEDAEDKAATEGGAEGAEGAAEGAAPKKKFPLMIVLIAAGVVVLLGGGAAAAYFMGVFGPKKEAAASAEEGAASEEGKDAEHKSGEGESKGKDGKKEAAVFYSLGEMMVNITGEGRKQTYLKLVVELELESEKDKAAIEDLKPRIVDNFQTYLRELRLDDLRGSAGLYRLREELLFRVNDAVHPIKVKDVLFQQMLVQ